MTSYHRLPYETDEEYLDRVAKVQEVSIPIKIPGGATGGAGGPGHMKPDDPSNTVYPNSQVHGGHAEPGEDPAFVPGGGSLNSGPGDGRNIQQGIQGGPGMVGISAESYIEGERVAETVRNFVAENLEPGSTLQGGGGGGHGPVVFSKVVDEFGREIKYKSEREAKTDDARYIADLITMLRWLADAHDMSQPYRDGPPIEIISWYNSQVVKELETFYERHKK